MKFGKQHIYELPVNDITTLGSYAQRVQAEAEARGEVVPPPIHLHLGEPSFRTPAHIRQAAIATIEQEPLTYGPAAGWPWLRELLAGKVARVNGYSVSAGNIVVAMGGTGAIQAILDATVGADDEVLVPDPCWPQYYLQFAACGTNYVRYPLDPQHNWLPDIDQLEQLVTPRTRILLINTPSNPTGAVYPPQLVRELLDFARRHDLYLLSDECYDELVFEGEHVSPGTLLEPGELEDGRFIGVYTFSKTYAMTGWRLGYIVTGKPLIKTLIDVLDAGHTNVSTVMQRAGAAALTGPQDCIAEMRAAYRRRRDLAVGLLRDYGRYMYTPRGAFYVLIDVSNRHSPTRSSRQFAYDLIHKYNLTVVPGTAFGHVSEPYVRVSLASSDEEIEQGIRTICQFADS
ncbi:MAG TPA: aminotransferase class I/II-fold pyridoxal phosphate-dependent enzyme [Ktedonobacteraceae bacterium]|jgi:aspartate aminotransferase/aminotransferase|nr:aminotransferase class I/II-fold pyridoxal phosphate-dependent enzyme [Ktedonobacteraceae bacterium]